MFVSLAENHTCRRVGRPRLLQCGAPPQSNSQLWRIEQPWYHDQPFTITSATHQHRELTRHQGSTASTAYRNHTAGCRCCVMQPRAEKLTKSCCWIIVIYSFRCTCMRKLWHIYIHWWESFDNVYMINMLICSYIAVQSLVVNHFLGSSTAALLARSKTLGSSSWFGHKKCALKPQNWCHWLTIIQKNTVYICILAIRWGLVNWFSLVDRRTPKHDITNSLAATSLQVWKVTDALNDGKYIPQR